MSFLLAKIYLLVIFVVLLVISTFLVTQIRLRQDLEKNLTKLQSIKTYQNNFKLGQIYLRKNIYNKAIQEFRLSFKNWDKEDRLGLASLFNTLGFTYYKLKEYEIAIYYYGIALQLTPDYITCLINVTYLYQTQNQISSLEESLNKVDQYDPTNKRVDELKLFLNRRL